jgi:hypothetical protein
VCGFRVGWQGETTQRAGARKAEQRGQAARKPCNRARSGVTQWVSAIGAANVSIHAASQGIRSGQLRFLGLFSIPPDASPIWIFSFQSLRKNITMSGQHFHVHGAHDHALEHAAQNGPGLAQYVAIFTAILATLGAVVSYQSGASQNEAMLEKNEAVLKKTQASDQWNFYQAKSNKGHLMELAHELAPPDKKAAYTAQVEKYAEEKKTIKQQAEALEAASKLANERSERAMQPHHKLALSMTLIQIAISLASITALTRVRWLFALAAVAAAGGIGLWALALAG